MVEDPADIKSGIIKAALKCASEVRWKRVSLRKIAEEADISVAEIYKYFPSKIAIVGALLERSTDLIISSDEPYSSNEPVHDRLIDNILKRFDILEQDKQAIISIVKDTKFDPLANLFLAPKLFDSMAQTLEKSGIDSSGLVGMMRIKGITVIYLMTFNIWIYDNSPDLAKTMAFLDRRLKQAVNIASVLPIPIIEKR
ncbi:MAG: hypothetical protein CMM37_10110 [Rhodospirillaceae bacterium]|nr:hypothetical protein [Rhodospirillaceae bacterium]